MHLPVKNLAHIWDVPLVLNSLLKKPFEQMVTSTPHLLSWKTAFLATIAPARHVGELGVLQVPLTSIFTTMVSLLPGINFLPTH